MPWGGTKTRSKQTSSRGRPWRADIVVSWFSPQAKGVISSLPQLPSFVQDVSPPVPVSQATPYSRAMIIERQTFDFHGRVAP
jgi:hypothetical protein